MINIFKDFRDFFRKQWQKSSDFEKGLVIILVSFAIAGAIGGIIWLIDFNRLADEMIERYGVENIVDDIK